jgi:tRNA nucleotidyltransferase (CCA-adding enzyme)
MQTYLVGGAVRDKLLDYPFHEQDWVVVGARPEDLLSQGYQQVGKDFPVFLHPQTKEEFALARTERKSGVGYHGFVCDFSPDITLEEDLSRRDLTINAMAEDIDGSIIDPYQGQRDIAAKLLRHVSPAFSEDPLRILRVARFAARYAHLGFRVADDTMALMTTMSRNGELQSIAAERIWVELCKALQEQTPEAFFDVLQDCGALSALHPDWSKSLNEKVYAALNIAAKQDLSVDIRFAISCQGLALPNCQSLCQALRASNSASWLAERCAQYLPLANFHDPKDWLAVLEAFDYNRRPERLEDFIQIARVLNTAPIILNQLQTSAEALRQIKTQDLIQQGFSGAALGEALREEKLRVLIEISREA